MNKEEEYMLEKFGSVLLTQNQTAEVLGVGRDILRELIEVGELTPVLIGKTKKFNINDLAKYMRGEK